MPIFIVECRIDSYATAEIEAATAEEAVDIAKGVTESGEDIVWDLDTDWDSSTDFKVVTR